MAFLARQGQDFLIVKNTALELNGLFCCDNNKTTILVLTSYFSQSQVTQRPSDDNKDLGACPRT